MKPNKYKTHFYCLFMQAESKRSENGESKSASEKDTNNAPAKKKKEVVYYDEKEDTKQEGLWHEAEKKHPWHNPPPKIKGRKKSLKHNTILKKKIALVEIITRSLNFLIFLIFEGDK